MSHPAVDEFIGAVVRLGWIDDVWLSGSLAAGDHRPGVSDIDLVAVMTTVPTGDQLHELERIHRHIDATVGRSAALGCTYVTEDGLEARRATHPTWTHGHLVNRWLSSIARAELLGHGIALVGRDPRSVLAPMQPDEISQAARDELEGYWSWAARRPWLFLEPATADLALISMARIRHTIATGSLVTKSRAIPAIRAPRAVVNDVRRRRTGSNGALPVAPVLALHAWRDTRRTIA